MGFITPCFIRKNTLELREKLGELGYNILNSGNTTLDAHNYDGNRSHKSIEEGRAIITSYGNLYGVIYDIDTVTKKGRIDCGTNEELFLAITALRDDTDENQWFIMDVECYVDIPKGTWFQSTDCNGEKHVGAQIEALYCHKATIEELIEHFKGKEENK